VCGIAEGHSCKVTLLVDIVRYRITWLHFGGADNLTPVSMASNRYSSFENSQTTKSGLPLHSKRSTGCSSYCVQIQWRPAMTEKCPRCFPPTVSVFTDFFTLLLKLVENTLGTLRHFLEQLSNTQQQHRWCQCPSLDAILSDNVSHPRTAFLLRFVLHLPIVSGYKVDVFQDVFSDMFHTFLVCRSPANRPRFLTLPTIQMSCGL
jgi:hypothetical protein